MHTEIHLALSVLIGALLVFCRITGVFIFLPLPGVRSGPDAARIVLALFATLALFPVWPRLEAPDIAVMAGWILLEAGLGIAVGLVIGFLIEAFNFGAQLLSLQGGFSYAATIDPNTEAESTVLITLSQLAAGMLFFATGLDQQVLLSFARSLEKLPPGMVNLGPSLGLFLIRLGSVLFSTGLRLVLPAIAFLLMMDVALALLSRINSQLQVVSLAFPVKILGTILILSSLASLLPRIFLKSSQPAFEALRMILQVS